MQTMQSYLFYCKIILHVSGVTAPIISSAKNRPILTTRLAQTTPDLAPLEGSSWTDNMTCNEGCGYSF